MMQRIRAGLKAPGPSCSRFLGPLRLACILICAVVALLGAAAPGVASAAVSCPNSNPVVNENNCAGAGTTANQLTKFSENVNGFSDQTSYNLGQSVNLKIGVQTLQNPADKVNISVYRIGYYGGTGARLISAAGKTNVTVNNSFACNAIDPTTGETSCSNWATTYTIPGSTLPVSGIYEAVLTDTSAQNIQNYVLFTVRNDARASKMLFVLPIASYEAYNTWGGKSLYFDKNGGANTISGSDRAVAVSFDRPFDFNENADNRFFGPDNALVQWVEEQGYDVTYTDDIQTDASPSSLLNHKIDVISGHSEYWSSNTFNNFLAARDAGVNIASFSGNTAYWQTRYTDNYRTLVCYKTVQGPTTPNDPASLGPNGQTFPNLATTTRRDPGAPAGTPGAPPGGRIGPNQPENILLGNMYVGDNETKQWALHVPAGDAGGQYAAGRIWRNTGLPAGGGQFSTGSPTDIVGWEWDQIPSASSPVYAGAAAVEPVGVKQLSLTNVTDPGDSFLQDAGNVRASTPPPGQPSTSSAVEYRAPSGAIVFAVGAIQWALALDQDPGLTQATYNLFADMGLQPDTPSGITPDSASYKPPPWAAFTMTPNPVHFGNTVTFDASSTSVTSGAQIVDYKWDFNGSGTFVDKGSSPTTTATYPTQGTYNVMLKVTDSNGQTDVTSRTLTVAGDPPPVASFTVTPAKPVVGQIVSLDASASRGSAHPIVDYKWDVDGSGSFATDTGTTPTLSTSFTSVGTINVGLKVTDSNGASGTTTVPVTVLATGASSYPDAIHATPGLLHYYRMGESAGPILRDSAGSANGTVTGGTWGQPGAIQGDPDTAVHFNGAGTPPDSGSIPMDLSRSSAITVEFWLKWDTYANDDTLAMEFTNNFNNNPGGFLVDPNSSFGQFAVSIGTGASRNVATFTRPSAGVWHHYAFVLDTTQPGATEITPYVDGQLVGYGKGGYSGTGAGNFASSTLYLFSRGGTSLNGTGSLDELAVYNGALDLTRIQDHYNSFGTNPRPVASLKFTPGAVKPGQTVTLDASASHYANGPITQYDWDLNGDGKYDKTTTTPTITTSYATAQTVNIGLRVTDSDFGVDYITKPLLVGNAPPVPSLAVNHNPAIANQTITFDASGSTIANGSITDYNWDLDGSGQFATDTGTTPTLSHAFALPGTYTVGLEVTSDAGVTATTTLKVQVLDQGVGDYTDTVLRTPGLLHYYSLGESAGPTIADTVGSAPGTVTGGTFGLAGAVQGDPNTAIGFNGTSDSAAIPMNLSASSAITVEFWLKWTGYANNDALAMELTSNFNDNPGGFLVDPNSSYGQFAVAIGSGGARNLALFPRPTAGVWHHYAFVLDTAQPGATEITPYVDGQAVSYTNGGIAGTGAGNFANSTLYLLSRAGTSLFGAGTLDNLAIYNGGLTGNQILDHYVANGTNHPPTAGFTSPPQVGVGQQITFDATSSNDSDGRIVDYQWDLDGSGKYATDTGSNPRLTTSFPTGGTKTIGLRVIDDGFASDTTSHSIVVGDTAPVALFTAPQVALTNQSVSLDGSGSTDQYGTIVDYKWDLDGSGQYATDGGTNPTVSHTYTTPGTYTIGLRVTNDQGQTSTSTQTLEIRTSNYPNSVLSTPGLVSYWRLGDPVGATTLADSSAAGNTASNSGATLGVPGAVYHDSDTAAGFDGASSYASAPLNLSSASAITVEFWLKWNAYANDDALAMEFTNNFNNNNGGFLVDPNSSFGQFAVAIGNGASRNVALFARPSAGVWHHYALVLDTAQPGANEITPYVDGQAVSYTNPGAPGTGAGNFANSTLYLMSRGGSSLFGTGSLDEVAIYSQAVSSSTIAGHYLAGAGPAGPAVTVAAPATAAAGTALTANSISTTLSGAKSGAGGTVAFKVFGPQAAAPATCTTGGTTVGSAVTVAGNGSYSPSAGFTPAAGGTYWWYASYSGDANNGASSSLCGSGMTSTSVSGATSTSVAAPATGAAGTAIAASSISSTLSGAASGAGGTVAFKVFGPQAAAPATCTTGGTTVGSAVTVAGNGSYSPSAGFTPAAGGTYWWYASYSGDANNNASASTCGTGMASTTVGQASTTTTTTVSAPATGAAGTAIAASSISSTLSGAASGAGGTVAFKVFGPQAAAPTTCTTGGTAVGTAVTVSGNGTRNPTAAFTPTTAGSYWWYASYSGDANNNASASTCGTGMASTTVGQASSTTTTVSAPPTGAAGTAIAASSISSTLAGAASGAGGTVTFKVFGPQAAAPTTCTTGGTAVGTAVTVSGNGTRNPTAAFTPTTAGSYWWYASYSGDANNNASASTCGTAMAKTVAYSVTSVANATDTGVLGNSTATSRFAVAANTTYLLLIYRNSSATDAITSITSSGLTPVLTTASFTSIASQTFNTSNRQWAYYVTTGAASGTGSLTVNFASRLGIGQVTILDLVRLQGNSTSSPIVTTNVGKTTGTATTATANLASAPGASDAGVVFLSAQQGLGTTVPPATPAMTNAFYSQQSAGTTLIDAAIPAKQSESFSVGAGRNWGTLALEVNHG